MRNDLNRVVLVGRLTKKPELKFTNKKTAIANFSLASNRSYKVSEDVKEEVSYFDCVAWARLGEVIAEHCNKGEMIGLEGRLQQRSWEDKEGKKRKSVDVVVENFQFLTSRQLKDKGTNSLPLVEEGTSFKQNEIPY